MIAILDAGYRENNARAACVLAHAFTDEQPCGENVIEIEGIAPYTPGKFYRRELPCLVAALNAIDAQPDIVVVDGFVTLSPTGEPGLGQYLYEELNSETPAIGVAKTSFAKATHALPLIRGRSKRPLFITSAGIDAQAAYKSIRSMHGNNRIPTLLNLVDRLSRFPQL